MQIHCKNHFKLITNQGIATAIMYHRLFLDNPTNWKSLLSTESTFLLKILALNSQYMIK